LNWEPQVSLEEGLAITYEWIAGQLAKSVSGKVEDIAVPANT
jgi:hypothetical protein